MTDSHAVQLPITEVGGAHSCSCCSSGEATVAASTPSGAVSTTYEVAGMTCEHCVRSVTEELSEIATVTGVEVALEAGGASKVTVRSHAPVDRAVITAAIREAGYRLVEA